MVLVNCTHALRGLALYHFDMWDAVLSLEDMTEICFDGYLMSLSRNEVIDATPRVLSPKIIPRAGWIFGQTIHSRTNYIYLHGAYCLNVSIPILRSKYLINCWNFDRTVPCVNVSIPNKVSIF